MTLGLIVAIRVKIKRFYKTVSFFLTPNDP